MFIVDRSRQHVSTLKGSSSGLLFETSQAHCINQYKKLRIKVLKSCANVYFNRGCVEQGIIPKYPKIKIPYTSPASTITQKKIQITRVKDEIKHPYRK